MNLHHLSAKQLQQLQASLKPRLAYIKRLRVRMEETRFPANDRFYRDILIAEMLLRDSLEMVEGAWSLKGGQN